MSNRGVPDEQPLKYPQCSGLLARARNTAARDGRPVEYILVEALHRSVVKVAATRQMLDAQRGEGGAETPPEAAAASNDAPTSKDKDKGKGKANPAVRRRRASSTAEPIPRAPASKRRRRINWETPPELKDLV